jgi:hypothetical protein
MPVPSSLHPEAASENEKATNSFELWLFLIFAVP